MKAKIKIVLFFLGVAAVFLGPDYIEHRNDQRYVEQFVAQAKERQLDSKVIRRLHDLSKPLTWARGTPILTAARQDRGDGKYLVMYAEVKDGMRAMSSVLVWADCATGQMRLVTQRRYEEHLKNSGYDTLGNKLPAWSDAKYEHLLSVMLFSEPTPGKQTFLYDVACRWDTFPGWKS